MPVPPATAARLDQIVMDVQRKGRAPSLIAAVTRGGEVEHLCAAGTTPEPTSDTQYRIGSITKTFTAMLIMQLRDEGLLDLDEPLSRKLPDSPVGSVRIRQLLGHISGLRREPEGPWWERADGVSLDTLLQGLTPDMLVHPPHRTYHYSNLAYGLLSAVASQITGEAWMDLVGKRLLAPLGMGRTTYQCQEPFARGYVVHPWLDTMREEPRHDSGAMAPAGQLWSTVTDLARWAGFIAGPSPDLINPSTLDEMTAPVVISDLESWAAGHGLGFQLWRRGERVLVGHSGSMPGYLALLAVHRKSGVAAIVFCNSYNANVGLSQLCGDLITTVLDAEPVKEQTWRPSEAAPPESIAPLCGRWWFMGQELEVTYDAAVEELAIGYVAARQQAPQRFKLQGEDRWRGLNGFNKGELLTVRRDESRAVTALHLASFELTRDPMPDL